MYKAFVFLSLSILINGCATTDSGENLSIFYTEKSSNLDNVRTTKTLTNYEDMKSQWRAEAINLNTGEKVFYGMAYSGGPGETLEIRKYLKNICEKNYSYWGIKQESGIDCVISRYQDEVYYKDFETVKDRYYKNRVNSGNVTYMTKLMDDEKFNQMKKARQERENMEKEIILAGLLSRCENFGWKDDDDLASCVQQEAYRDLQLEKQKHEINMLEQKLASAQNRNIDDDEPLFFMFLDAYAQSKQRDSMLQMKKDIASLKASSSYRYKRSSTEAALKSLYRTNN
tara:strand:- start:190 stop:1044 length:855 start_codon:yes stop_codon:yes gene_type:complete